MFAVSIIVAQISARITQLSFILWIFLDTNSVAVDNYKGMVVETMYQAAAITQSLLQFLIGR